MAIAYGFQVLFNQVGDDFGVGFRAKLVAFLDQFPLQGDIVLNDAVVDDNNLAGAVAMRVSILLSRATVGSPAGVADAVGAVERIETDHLFQVAQLALGAAHLQAVTIAGDGDSSRVVAAVFQPAQAIDDDGNDLFLTYIANNAAHRLILLKPQKYLTGYDEGGTCIVNATIGCYSGSY